MGEVVMHRNEDVVIQVSSQSTGWLCPACGRGNAPTSAVCPCVQQSRPGIRDRIKEASNG